MNDFNLESNASAYHSKKSRSTRKMNFHTVATASEAIGKQVANIDSGSYSQKILAIKQEKEFVELESAKEQLEIKKITRRRLEGEIIDKKRVETFLEALKRTPQGRVESQIDHFLKNL